jgi:uncharacterized protein (TIGR03083 family)
MDLARAELTALVNTAASLTPHELAAPSLCEGWRIDDVLAHLTWYGTASGSALARTAIAGHLHPGHAMNREFFRAAIRYRSTHDHDEMISTLRELGQGSRSYGPARLIARPAEFLIDYVVHHADIRRPLRRPTASPSDAVVAALREAPRVSGLIGARRRSRRLRLVATDIGWQCGAGPVVEGTAESLLLALTGRSLALDELRGDGVATLADRLR